MVSAPRRQASFPIRIYGALAFVAVVLGLAWAFWPPKLRVSAPTLETGPGKVTVSASVTNDTSTSRAVTVRFAFGYSTLPSDYAPTEFRVLESRDVTAQVAAHSRETVSCEFSRPQKTLVLKADSRIVSAR